MNEEGNQYDFGFIITKAPLESLLTFNFLTIAKNAMEKEKAISFFLISDGIWLVKKNQKNKVVELLQHLIKNGASITVSKDHLDAAGIEITNILPGISITDRPYTELVDFVMEKCRRVMTL